MALTREQILAADDLAVESVPVPEWGGDVRVRMMSGEQRDQLTAMMVAASDASQNVTAVRFGQMVVSLCLVDDDGALLFGADRLDELRKKQPHVIERLALHAIRINGLGPGAVEEAKKPSETIQSSGSGSDSPSPLGEQSPS
ncbi:hypothetical protein PPN31114_03512 [Pandoraea pneumonica]|uniref:Phage tail protein n=1 Tax=Pandoraea pneumonica TaxID=2508299 RepID=A0A5E4WYD8_9BURK|nr:hypothetical protein [Pandoraea pneumonica]VVE28185.1 hypothetical protein PPN31114_03512 [Pandoraea pneumonica]